jgi:hypothetical protein
VLRQLRDVDLNEVRHPDADVLTAFAEHSLAARERAEVMRHLVHCGDCREVLALSLPATETYAPARMTSTRGSWLAWPMLRWGALAAGLLIIGTVGVLQYVHRPHEAIIASNFPNSAPESMKDSSSAVTATSTTSTDSTTDQAIDAKQPSASQKPLLFNSSQAPTENVNGFRIGRHGPRNAGVEPQGPDGSDIFENSVSGQPSASLGSSANGAPQWTVTPVGGLQRSYDEGKNWENVHPEGDLTFTASFLFRAVASNGLDVWVGGSEGALFHSVDGGNRWIRQMPSASGAVLEGDVLRIQFVDPHHGKIVTSTGQLWTTADDGQNWQKQ